MVITYDPDTREAVIFSAWGPNTESMRNLRAHPALRIQIGRDSYLPEQHFLSEDDAVAVALEFDGGIPGGCDSSPSFSAGVTSAPSRPCATSCGADPSSRFARRLPRRRITSE